MTEKLPLVSVVIPVYNGESYLREAIDSVLSQTYGKIELLLVDDGSCDSSAEIASSYSDLRYIKQENKGVASARNRGIAESKGDYITFLDQDDYWSKSKLELQINYLERHSTCGFVFGYQRLFVDPLCEKPTWVEDEHLVKDIPSFLLGALCARRNLFQRVGLFNEEFVFGNDTDWFSRAKDLKIEFHMLENLVLFKRVHASNESHKRKLMQKDLFGLLRQSIERKKDSE